MAIFTKKIWRFLFVICLAIAFVFVLLRALGSLGEQQFERREQEYDTLIASAAAKHQVPEALIKAVIWKESRFNAKEIGSKGEVGLMQITPIAAEEWRRGNNQPNFDLKTLKDPKVNVDVGTWYLAWTGKHWQDYKSQQILQLAEYNAGYGRVSKLWKPDDPQQEISVEDISFPGTRSYIKQVLQKRQFYEQQHLEQNMQ